MSWEEAVWWESLVRPWIGGGRWLVASELAVSAGAQAKRLVELGAERPFVLAGMAGTGDPPDPGLAEVRVLGLAPAGELMAAIRAWEAALHRLPAEVVGAIEAWDPERRARVLGDIFARGTPIVGRRYFGARPHAGQALEDKTVADALWDAAGWSARRAGWWRWRTRRR